MSLDTINVSNINILFYSLFTLPKRSYHWNILFSMPLISSNTPLTLVYTRKAIVLDSPMSLAQVYPCPVDDDNRHAWTEVQRDKANHGCHAKDIKHLKDIVR